MQVGVDELKAGQFEVRDPPICTRIGGCLRTHQHNHEELPNSGRLEVAFAAPNGHDSTTTPKAE